MYRKVFFLLLAGLSVSLTGCLRTCSISPEASDRLYFSNEILDQYGSRKRFTLLELDMSRASSEKEKLVSGTYALIVRDDAAARWAVNDPFTDVGGESGTSTWVLLDPLRNSSRQRIPLKAGDDRIPLFERLCADQSVAALGSTNIVDVQQIFDSIENCRAVFIPGKTQFQFFAATPDTRVAHTYRDALGYGEGWPSLTRRIAEDDELAGLLNQFRRESGIKPTQRVIP